MDTFGNGQLPSHEDLPGQFQRAVKLFETGRAQEGADVLQTLADVGYEEAIEQLVYIFLDQKDFLEVQRLLALSTNQNSELISYLRGRSLQEQGRIEEAREAIIKSATLGHHGSLIWMIEFSVNHGYLEDGRKWLLKAKQVQGWSVERTQFIEAYWEYCFPQTESDPEAIVVDHGHNSSNAVLSKLVEWAFSSTSRLSEVDSVRLLMSVLEAARLAGLPEGWHLLGERIVWRFPDDIILTLAPEEGLFIGHLEDELNASTRLGSFDTLLTNYGLTWKPQCNGFQLANQDTKFSPEEIVEVVGILSLVHGSPELILPWPPEAFDELIERDEDDEEDAPHIGFFIELTKSEWEVPGLAWTCVIEEAYDAAMPAFSSYYRFERVWQEFQMAGWTLYLGTRNWGEEEEQAALEDDESAGTWRCGLGIETYPWQATYGRSGWIDHPLVFRSPQCREEAERMLLEAGLTVEVVDEDSLRVT